MSINSRENYINMIKRQKNSSLNINKKLMVSKHINNNKILKKNNNKNKNKNKLENNKIKKYKNKGEMINTFDRNNKFIEQLYFDDSENSSNYINKSNYIIKVKTKINPNDKELLVKNFNNLLNLDDINIDNDNNFDEDILYRVERNSEHIKPSCHNSNRITKKNIRYYKDFDIERNYLEKIKFIQLWWKTIFQIIKIQKHLRGFLYRQRLIEELDKEEIAVDNLLFFIKSYKKIVFKIFIFRLRKFNPRIRYFLFKWNEIINKKNIIKQLLAFNNHKEKKNINSNNYETYNRNNDLTDLDYENFFLRDSTNSLINNIDMINNNYNKYNHLNNDLNSDDEDNVLLGIDNVSLESQKKNFKSNLFIPIENELKDDNLRKNIILNNSKNLNKLNKVNNQNICKNKINKINKNKKIKKNLNEASHHRNSANINNKGIGLKNLQQKIENDFIKNCHTAFTNPLILSSGNKFQRRTKNKTNILNLEDIKSQHPKMNINNMTGKRIKRNRIENKLVEKEIIPFSVINNFENISKLENSLSSSNNSSNMHFKKLKIYENHLQDYKNLNQKKSYNKNNNTNNNINNEKKPKIKNGHNNHISMTALNENTYTLKKNLMTSSIDQLQINKNIYNNHIDNNYSYPQNPTELSNNNINTISSFNTTIFNTIKSNKNYYLGKYFKFWFDKSFLFIIKNKLRSLLKLSNFSIKLKNIQLRAFFGNFKKVYNIIFTIKLKEYFDKYKNKIIKVILIKCSEYKVFIKYREIVFKRIILKKLKEYLIKKQKIIYNEIENDIKNFNKNNFFMFNSTRKKVIKNNQNQLFIQLNSNNQMNNLMSSAINKSMLNLIHPLDQLKISNNNNKEYNLTEENEPFNFNPNNIKKNIDMITQVNQLTMVINLIEQLRIKNKKNNQISLLNLFKKWKNFSNNLIIKTQHKNKNNYNIKHEHTVATDIEELTQHTLTDNKESESELGSKSDQMTFTLSSKSNNIKSNKYVPVRGVKYFHGKIKQKNINSSKVNNNYKINNLIDKYKTNTILTKNNNDSAYNKYNKIELTESKTNVSDNYKTFNDCNIFDYNNILINNRNNYLNMNNLIAKTNINDIQSNQNSKNIYHRKAIGTTFKNNNLSRIDYKNLNYNQYTNDNINCILDNYYDTNFLGLLNNQTFLGECKIEPIIFLNNNNRNNDNLIDDIQSKYGFKKLNKIEEKEICFFPNKNENNLNIIKNKNNDYANISIVSEMKKYYNEYIDIYNNDEQKKKFNSFIINIFNNNIIMTQKIETKRSKSK